METKIQRTQIIGTRLVIFSAWQRCAATSVLELEFSTITTIRGEWWGHIGTEHVPADIQQYAGTPEWRPKYDAWRKGTYQRAYDLILAEHPELIDGKRDMGDIEIWLPETSQKS